MAKAARRDPWRSRIVGEGDAAPEQLLANPQNWRLHPKPQQDALAGVLDQVGYVQRIVVNRRTGHIVDGHLRVELAISRREPTIPVLYVDLSEDEERLILAALDPLAAMAATDSDALASLLAGIEVQDAALREMLEQMAGTDSPDWEGALGGLPDGERGAFRQMTFTLTARQEAVVQGALSTAKAAGGFDGTGNENSNGNALARICESYRG